MKITCIDITKIFIEHESGIKTLVLRGIDLDIHSEDREWITIFGPSGCGKSTLLEILTLCKPPTTGFLRINDVLSNEIPLNKRHSLFQTLGYSKQYSLDNIFLHYSVHDNIRFALKSHKIKEFTRKSRIEELLENFCLDHRGDAVTSHLSGGELQRLSIAIAVSSKPEIFFLDEPFSALDYDTRNECHDELIRLHKMWEIPILLVTHDFAEAEKLGDRIIHINQGVIEKESFIKK